MTSPDAPTDAPTDASHDASHDAGGDAAATPTRIDLDELARLEEERRFLMRSLDDLEREYAAGDVDEDDYLTLKDGYTARAAATLRAIEAGRAALPPARSIPRGRTLVWVVSALAFAAFAGWGLAQATGTRQPGETITGGQPADEVAIALTEARALLSTGDYGDAFERFQRVVELEPDNSEARTYIAWILVLNTRLTDDPAVIETSLSTAIAAFAGIVEDDPGYADAHCLYAVTAANFLPEPDLDLARAEGQRCLESDPPASMRGLVQEFLAGIEASTVPPSSAP